MRTWRRRGWGTHVYMHCIAKTLLTELHLAILVPLLCLRNFSPSHPPANYLVSLSRSRPVSLFRSRSPSRTVATSLRLSFSRFEVRRVSTYAKSYSIRLRKIVPYDGGELMARVMEVEARVVGRGRGERDGGNENEREREKGGRGRENEQRNGAGFQESGTASLNP